MLRLNDFAEQRSLIVQSFRDDLAQIDRTLTARELAILVDSSAVQFEYLAYCISYLAERLLSLLPKWMIPS